MKVIVGYTGYIEKEIEIDDAFAPCADPSLDNTRFFDALTDEVFDKFRRQVDDYDEICCIKNEKDEYILEF